MGKKILAIIIVIAVGVIILYYALRQDNGRPAFIETSGIIESTEVEIAAKIPERIEWLCCKEGDRVEAGLFL